VFDLLADETRRHVIYYLTDVADGAATTSEIAEHLRAVDPASRSAEREAVLVGLHHRHLPRLEATGIVEYDDPRGSVRYLGDPLVEECLALVAPWDLGGEP
jgi:predicted transcriptional regulator with HTH domain